MVELDIVDLIGGLGLESLIQDVVFSIGHVQLLRVEDRSETGVGNETAA